MNEPESSLDLLWAEYAQAFQDFDELRLARWLSQTLGQMEGKPWRLSHPLVATYRLVAELAHQKQVWLKRLTTAPQSYAETECCRAPALPLLTRDVREAGLICLHCKETLVPFAEIPSPIRERLADWADAYSPIHAVAHWDDRRRRSCGNYDRAYEKAAEDAESLLAQMGLELAPALNEIYPAVVWEDNDDCLEVGPEDIPIGRS